MSPAQLAAVVAAAAGGFLLIVGLILSRLDISGLIFVLALVALLATAAGTAVVL